MKERLQKLIASAGLCARRTAEDWIAAGRVCVNGAVASLGDRADLETDTVTVDGAPDVQLTVRSRLTFREAFSLMLQEL